MVKMLKHKKLKPRFMTKPHTNGHAAAPLKLDLGCGPNPREGFAGVDRIAFNERIQEFDLRQPWPWADQSVSEVWCSHFVEHLEPHERCHFFNELYRILKPNRRENGRDVEGFATIVVPHWGSCRAYGDPTHRWPPMGEMFWYYLCEDWRLSQAPHTDKRHWEQGYNCHLECRWGNSWNPAIAARNEEWKAFAALHYREAIHDMQCVVTRKERTNGR